MPTIEERLTALEQLLTVMPRANPPATIGELADVPAPGSPIVSPWAQEVSNRIVHRFATAAARDAWNTRAAGSYCYIVGTKQFQYYDGGGWVTLAEPNATFPLTLLQGADLGTTGVTITRWHRRDGWVEYFCLARPNVAGTVGGQFYIQPTGLPAPEANGAIQAGTFRYFDSGTGTYTGAVSFDGIQFTFVVHNAPNNLGQTPNFGAANGDYIALQGAYYMANRYG